MGNIESIVEELENILINSDPHILELLSNIKKLLPENGIDFPDGEWVDGWEKRAAKGEPIIDGLQDG